MENLVNRCNSEMKRKIWLGKNQKLLIHLTSNFENNTDAITRHRIKTTDIAFECKRGCNYCCNLRVEILPPEAFYIANHIKSLSSEMQEGYMEKLKESSRYSLGKTFVEYNKPCSFLSEKGTCEIYSVRPHKCRSHLSKSVSSCIKTRNADEDYNLKVAHNQLAHGTVTLYKNKGCVMHPTELAQGVLAALEDSTLESKWCSGVQVFELLPEKIEL